MRSEFMSNQEILAELKSNSLLNKARRILSATMAEIETGALQRKPLTIFEMQNLEFSAVIEIAHLLGVKLHPGAEPHIETATNKAAVVYSEKPSDDTSKTPGANHVGKDVRKNRYNGLPGH